MPWIFGEHLCFVYELQPSSDSEVASTDNEVFFGKGRCRFQAKREGSFDKGIQPYQLVFSPDFWTINSRWWQLNFFLCSPRKWGEDEPNLTSIFFRWVVQPPTSYRCSSPKKGGNFLAINPHVHFTPEKTWEPTVHLCGNLTSVISGNGRLKKTSLLMNVMLSHPCRT